jgi:hypothetical protein
MNRGVRGFVADILPRNAGMLRLIARAPGIVTTSRGATSGHAATPLPKSAMNSRRLIGLTPRLRIRTNYSTVHRSKKQPLMSGVGLSATSTETSA